MKMEKAVKLEGEALVEARRLQASTKTFEKTVEEMKKRHHEEMQALYDQQNEAQESAFLRMMAHSGQSVAGGKVEEGWSLDVQYLDYGIAFLVFNTPRSPGNPLEALFGRLTEDDCDCPACTARRAKAAEGPIIN